MNLWLGTALAALGGVLAGGIGVFLLWQITRRQNALPMLEIAFRFQRRLLNAVSEDAVLRAAMQAGMDVLRAEGVSFVPFDEWRLTFPPLYLGKVPHQDKRLTDPGTRQACKLCQKRRATSECVLLDAGREPSEVWCTPLRQSGREIGMLNYYFNRGKFAINDTVHFFVSEMVSLVDVTLQSLQSRSKLPPENLPVHQAIMDERSRLAREIHDGLAQTLAFLKMETSRMQNFLAQGQTDRLDQALQGCMRTLADAYLDARQAIDDLRRQPEDDLVDWLKRAACDFETLTALPVEMQIDVEQINLPAEVALQLARIIQEALVNVRKHAQAKRVWVRLLCLEKDLVVEIQDDGQGFSPVLGVSEARYGLRGMRERAESIGADFQVISRLGGGTTVQVRLPAFIQEAP